MVPRYERVLVTTDFSKLGNAAIPHAFALLGGRPGTVVLCHVLERPPLPNPLYAHYTPGKAMTREEREALVDSVADKLNRQLPKRLPRGAKAEIRVPDTDEPVHEAICSLARAVRADVLVIASHGHSGLARVFLGSTAERVLRLAHRPVLVVRS